MCSEPRLKSIEARPAASNDDAAWQPVAGVQDTQYHCQLSSGCLAGCLPYTAWDQWQVREGDLTVRELIAHFRSFYGLLVWSVFFKGQKLLEELGAADVETGAARKAAVKELAEVIDCRLVEVSRLSNCSIVASFCVGCVCIQLLQNALDEDGAAGEDSTVLDEATPIELLVTFRTPLGDVIKQAPQVIVFLSEEAR